jgi:hypothetical protein
MIYDSLYYTYPVSGLWSGGSYGNLDCFARTDRLSNLDGFWHAGSNDWLCGRIELYVQADGQHLKPVHTRFYPGHQLTTLALHPEEAEQRQEPGWGLEVEARKTVFVPYGVPAGEGSRFYTVLSLLATSRTEVTVTLDVRWPPVYTRHHTKQPERYHVQRRVRQRLEPYTVDNMARAILWAETVPLRVDRWDTVLGNAGEVRAILLPGEPHATFSEPGRARLVFELALTPHKAVTLPFVLAVSTDGPEALRAQLLAETFPTWEEALALTRSAYEGVLSTTLVRTPNARINRGLQWAKANTVRVQHEYRLGMGFTNDPPQDIVVVRDCAWFGMGADWFTPGFVQGMYDLILRYGVHEGGKITEYIHADTGQREDYGLNINDDTPLFVLGAHHHYAVTGDEAFLHRAYSAVAQACDWVLAQRGNHGLVWCTVQGADVWGSATWRNIIPGYTLNGAVTEVNALCCWALRQGAELADELGRHEDAHRWRTAAHSLREAINARLGTPDGLYVLNLSEEGEANATRTADLIFPVLAGVADEERARCILDLLYGPQFYTPYGVRTVGLGEAEYHPHFGHGLMGGVWPNLSAWVAYAGRSMYPERLVEVMDHLYALCEPEDPAKWGHVVPGEFPEWLDGDSLESLGMAMSPWMPPTYLWLGIEGLAGVSAHVRTREEGSLSGHGPEPEQEPEQEPGLEVNPNLPAGWRWLVVRNLPYQGERISFFVCDRTLYTTRRVASRLPQQVFQHDESDEVVADDGLWVVALDSPRQAVLLVTAAQPESAGTVEGTVRFRGREYRVRLSAGECKLIRYQVQDI